MNYPKARQRIEEMRRYYNRPSPEHAGLNALIAKLEWVK